MILTACWKRWLLDSGFGMDAVVGVLLLQQSLYSLAKWTAGWLLVPDAVGRAVRLVVNFKANWQP